jgi:hypothetical protein
MSALEELTNEVFGLEGRRDGLKIRIAELADELERARAEHDTRVKTETAMRRRKRFWLLAIVVFAVLLVISVVVVIVSEIDEETLTGRVTSAQSPRVDAPAVEGAECNLRFVQEYGPYNAKLFIDCGGSRLYGSAESFGAIRCETEGTRIIRCEDDGDVAWDGDPRLRFDRAAGTVRIDDSLGWSIEIELD